MERENGHFPTARPPMDLKKRYATLRPFCIQRPNGRVGKGGITGDLGDSTGGRMPCSKVTGCREDGRDRRAESRVPSSRALPSPGHTNGRQPKASQARSGPREATTGEPRSTPW